MSGTVRELIVKLGFDVDEKPLKKFEQGLETIKVTALAVGAAIAAAGVTMFELAKSASESAERIRETSEAVGVSQEEIQKLGYAASLSGSSFEETGDSLRFLSRAMLEAKQSGGPAWEAFHKLGVAVSDGNGHLKPTTDILYQLSDRFKALPPGAEKTAYAMSLFGRGGARFIQFLNQGSSGLREMGEELEAFGGVMSDADVETGKQFADSLNSLKAIFGALKNAIGVGLIPPLLKLTQGFKDWVIANKDLIKSGIQEFIKKMTAGFDYAQVIFFGFVNLVRRLSGVFEAFSGIAKVAAGVFALFALGRFGMALANVVEGFFSIAKAAVKAGASILFAEGSALAIPILIGLALVAAGLLIDDFVAYLQGRDSIIGALLKNKDKFIADLAAFVTKVKEFLLTALAGLTEKFLEFFGVPADQAKVTAGKIKAVFSAIFDYLGDWASANLVFFGNVFDQIAQVVVAFVASPMDAFNNLGAILKNLASGIALAVFDLFTGMIRSLLNLFGLSSKGFEDWVANIRAALEPAIKYLAGLMGGFVDAVKDQLMGLANAVIDTFAAVVQFISDIFNKGITGALGDLFKNLLTPIKDLWAGLTGSAGAISNAVFGQAGPASGIGALSSGPGALSSLAPSVPQGGKGVTDNSNTSAQVNINVNVPQGANAHDVGESVRQAVRDELGRHLRPANRALKAQVAY